MDGRKEYPLYGVVLRAIKNRLVSESPLPGREPQDGNRTLECNNCGRSVPVGGVIKAGTTCSIWLGGNNYCHGKFSPVLKPAPQLPVRPEDEDSDVIIPGNEYRALLHDQAGYRALLEVLEDLRKFTAPPKAGK